MTAIIRKANIEDASELSRFSEQLFRSTFSHANSIDDMNAHCNLNFSPMRQEQEISNHNMLILLAEANREIIGFIQTCNGQLPECLVNVKSAAEIRRLYVSPQYHGRGIAHQLMQAAINNMIENGMDCTWLGVWEHNPRAIRFYKKSGFIEVGEQEFYLGRDLQRDLIMARHLSPGSE